MIANDSKWQQLATIGNNWQQLATIGNNWQQLAAIGSNWQQIEPFSKGWRSPPAGEAFPQNCTEIAQVNFFQWLFQLTLVFVTH
jgi:hypothetical protein